VLTTDLPVIIVTGSRTWADRDALRRALADVFASGTFVELWHGGAPGADALAARWAISVGLPVRMWVAHWSAGPGAGPVRNAAMIGDAPAGSIVVAFFNKPAIACRGTRHAVELARRRGLPVTAVYDDGHVHELLPAPELPYFQETTQ
jgi:hypothetical protein